MDNATRLDEDLLNDAIALSGETDRDAVINEALRLYVRIRRQRGINELRGNVKWEGDLDQLRRGRWTDADS